MEKFRNPIVSLFLSFMMLIVSCTKYETKETIDADQLKSMHQEIRLSYLDAIETDESGFLKSTYKGNPELEKQYLENLEYVNEYGVEGLFEKYGLELEILNEFDFYKANESDQDVSRSGQLQL